MACVAVDSVVSEYARDCYANGGGTGPVAASGMGRIRCAVRAARAAAVPAWLAPVSQGEFLIAINTVLSLGEMGAARGAISTAAELPITTDTAAALGRRRRCHYRWQRRPRRCRGRAVSDYGIRALRAGGLGVKSRGPMPDPQHRAGQHACSLGVRNV